MAGEPPAVIAGYNMHGRTLFKAICDGLPTLEKSHNATVSQYKSAAGTAGVLD